MGIGEIDNPKNLFGLWLGGDIRRSFRSKSVYSFTVAPSTYDIEYIHMPGREIGPTKCIITHRYLGLSGKIAYSRGAGIDDSLK